MIFQNNQEPDRLFRPVELGFAFVYELGYTLLYIYRLGRFLFADENCFFYFLRSPPFFRLEINK